MEELNKNSKVTATYLPKSESGGTFPVNHTALLVIDPVNDFLSEGGAAWELTKKTVEDNNVIPNLRRAIEGARAKGIPVLFGPMAYTEEDYAQEHLQCRSGINRMMYELKMFQAGTWGADFHPELQPQDTDTILLPHKSCDVFQTDLAENLEKRNITHLVIAGMTANLCCESTGRHAMEAGYDVTFLADAIGAAGLMEYEAAININFPLIANNVIKVDDFLTALNFRSTDISRQIQPGDTVKGSDNGEIGKVTEVVAATGDTEGYLLVPRGVIFHTDTFIPMDAIAKYNGKDVFLNVPKIMAGKMPWTEAPTLENRKDKQGSSAARVNKLYNSHSPSILDKPASF